MIEPTRELEKTGLKFEILNPARWNPGAFAGICMANGCAHDMAFRLAGDLGTAGARMTTIRPLKDWETFKAACKMIGVHVQEIPPL